MHPGHLLEPKKRKKKKKNNPTMVFGERLVPFPLPLTVDIDVTE